MLIEILRTYQPKQTIGELVIDGVEICKTLELQWLHNERNKSCIPEGTYTVVKRLAHAKRKYNHFHITDVPNRTFILIHTGNYSSQILGCILVGDRHIDLNRDGLVDVANSATTLTKLYDLLPDKFQIAVRNKEYRIAS
ncbi:hypothetical protein KK083_21485 [Fulvivirgaceae bacterium PWU4]|uniref:DUF5675 domain-containing protein n=1 Tax=Chryseosolibacter histidini TaxID=2782349 RepID=A0AAP2DN96_9BACT|nr:DUF5675 family protein [Chryseosolibacter histidini]MBT1699485.1 hypothetical protein [Chryseosolibacter histidini]